MAAKKKAKIKHTKAEPGSTGRKRIRGIDQTEERTAISPEVPTALSGGQSGDVQGLSSTAGADSESVVELLEEGNAFEAAIVAGVENAANNDQREVHTHEVLEDDVPDEYLERD